MLKKLGIIAFVYVGALVCAFLLASTAKAASEADGTPLAVGIFSQFKTFGDFGKWLQVYNLANTQELRGIEATLKKNGLDFKSELSPGKFTPNRLSWDDLYISKLVIGDWKTIGGKILVHHKETSVDGLFDQAMKTFEPRSAALAPFFIEPANAASTAKTRASAAAAWTWIVVATHRASSWIGSHAWSDSVGRVKCSPDGKYLVEAGWAETDKSLHAEKLPDHPLDPEIVAAMVKKDRALFSKCSDQTAAAATGVLRSPGKNAAEKMKYSASEFNFGMASALDETPHNAAHAAR